MSVVLQFQPRTSLPIFDAFLIGGRAEGSEEYYPRISFRATANQKCAENDDRVSRLKLKHHQHEVGGLIWFEPG